MILRRWIALLVGAVVALVALTWWRIESSWQEMSQAADRAQAKLESVSSLRPVAWGKAAPGQVWDGYLEAEKALAATGLEDFVDSRGQDVEGWFEMPRQAGAECWKSVDGLHSIFALMREAAHRRDAKPPVDWAKGFSGVWSTDVQIRTQMSRLLGLRAWQLQERGDDVEAVRTVLDALQYARDQAEFPVALASLVGTASLSMVAKRFFQTVDDDGKKLPAAWSVQGLSRPALQVFRDGLANLDRPLAPLGRLVRAEAVLLAREVEAIDGSVGDGLSVAMMKNSWRFAFSQRWMCAEGVLHGLELGKEFPTAASWVTWRDHLKTVEASKRVARNPVTLMVAVNYTRLAVGRREGVVALRVLRMLVDAALGESREHADPFGTELQVREVDGETHYWSVGSDGVGQGGDPKQDLVYVR
ncbi:MAG: hypothetical protein VX951_12365 [Planctomycetota bacterium]|nr:hypothetical protein [Planctomycetota bacterium]